MNLDFTISEIFRLIKTYRNDVEKFHLQSVQEIFDFTKNIPYKTDFESCSAAECLKRPAYVMAGGGADCDDKTIFAAAALSRINIPWRIVTVSYRLDKVIHHIYLEIFYNGKWCAFDATYQRNVLFQEKPFTKKIIWNEKMKIENLGYDIVAITGAVDAALQGIKSILKSFGLDKIFKGKTAYISEPKASEITNAYAIPIRKIWENSDAQEDKNFLYEQVKKFYYEYAATIEPQTKWQNHLQSYIQNKLITSTDPATLAFWRVHAAVRYAVMNIGATSEDGFKANFNNWFIDPYFKGKLLTPITVYFESKYGKGIITKLQEDKPIDQKGTGILPAGFDWKWLAIAAAAAVAFFGFKRMKK